MASLYVDLDSELFGFFFFSSRRRHTRFDCDWSSDVCSSDLKRIFRWKTASKSKQCVGVGQTAISQAVVRLSGDCMLEVHDAFVQRVFSSLVEEIGRAHV